MDKCKPLLVILAGEEEEAVYLHTLKLLLLSILVFSLFVSASHEKSGGNLFNREVKFTTRPVEKSSEA
ncbi:MAG: hypothetical protein AB1847_10470 [bacterium]